MFGAIDSVLGEAVGAAESVLELVGGEPACENVGVSSHLGYRNGAKQWLKGHRSIPL